MPTSRFLPAALLALACGGSSPPVPVLASAADIRRLAGEWVGEYASAQTGRAGSILFALDSAEDHAHGDVVMGPANRVWSGFSRDEMSQRPARAESQVLTIRFVRAAGGEVSGTLEPYTDPQCRCTVRTEFYGRLRADTIAGRFEIRPVGGGSPRRGEWRVVRQRS
jgi:hypothetical protein